MGQAEIKDKSLESWNGCSIRGIEADLVDCMVALPGQPFGKFRMN